MSPNRREIKEAMGPRKIKNFKFPMLNDEVTLFK